MSCKDVVGDLFHIFPSDSRQKRWEEDNAHVAQKTVVYVQQKVKHLLKNDHFLNAVDENEAVRTFTSSFVFSVLSHNYDTRTA